MKYRPSTIVKQMKAEGFAKFSMQQHTNLWQEKDAKNAKIQYGTQVEAGTGISRGFRRSEGTVRRMPPSSSLPSNRLKARHVRPFARS